MKRPSFQFYPGDWRANSNLRRCSFHERGVWIDVIGLMHDSDEYGVLRWDLEEIAAAVGCKTTDLLSLRKKNVLKGADGSEVSAPLIYTPRSGRKTGPAILLLDAQKGPIWYSSRMVRDEYIRTVRAGLGDSPKGGMGEAPKAVASVALVRS